LNLANCKLLEQNNKKERHNKVKYLQQIQRRKLKTNITKSILSKVVVEKTRLSKVENPKLLKVERSKLLKLEKSRLPKVIIEMLGKSNMQKHDAKNENINTYKNHNAYNVF
jgi:hypothetical protein